MQSIWLENILRDRPPRWLPSAYASYEDLLGASVEAAVNAPDAPKILASWDWGALNAIDIRHPIFGQIPILRRWAGPGMHPQAGSPYTLKAVSPDHGPSERMTVDLSNWDESTLNLVTGEAGNFLSPYATDQWTAWYEGSTFRLEFSPGAVANARSHELLLEPRPQASSPSR
jgi:penicillin amidase